MREHTSTLAAGQGSDRLVSPVSEIMTDRSELFSSIMDDVRNWLGNRRVAEQFAAIAECDVRSAARYFAGERIPPGDVVFALMALPGIGPRVLERITDEARRRLSVDDFEIFKSEMAKAVLRAFVRESGDVRTTRRR